MKWEREIYRMSERQWRGGREGERVRGRGGRESNKYAKYILAKCILFARDI